MSGKRDALDLSVSLDLPLDSEDGGETLGDMQESDLATQDFEIAQQRIWLEQLHDVLEIALNELPEEEHAVIKARYYEGKTRREIGPKARQMEERALKYLRRPYVQKWLHDFVEERTPYYLHVGVTRFKNTGISATEQAVFEREHLTEYWISKRNR